MLLVNIDVPGDYRAFLWPLFSVGIMQIDRLLSTGSCTLQARASGSIYDDPEINLSYRLSLISSAIAPSDCTRR